HFHEQLVERLLALVVPTAEAGTAMAADRVDFVDEDDARRVLLGLLEHVAHAAGADADEHLDEVGTGDREERHLRLAGDRLGEQRFAGARRAHHQHAARDAPAELLELRRVAEEFDQLGHFLLRLVTACDVGERDGVVRLVKHPRLALAEAERAAPAAALHLPHEEDPHADQQQHREPRDEDLREEALLFLGTRLDLDAVLDEVADHPDVAGAIGDVTLLVRRHPLDRPTLDGRGFDAAAARRFHEIRVRDGILGCLPRIELLDDGQHDEPDDEPDPDVLQQIVQAMLLAAVDSPGRPRAGSLSGALDAPPSILRGNDRRGGGASGQAYELTSFGGVGRLSPGNDKLTGRETTLGHYIMFATAVTRC